MTTVAALPRLAVEARRSLGDALTVVSWAPPGDMVAAASLAGEVHVLPARPRPAPPSSARCPPAESDSTLVASHRGGGLCLAWSQEGAWLASGGADGRVAVEHCRSGSSLKLKMGSWVRALAWSRQGWLAAAAGREVQAVHLEEGHWHHLPPQPGTVTALAWCDPPLPWATPTRLAVAGVGGLRWYQVPQLDQPTASWWNGSGLLSLALDRAGAAVAAGSLTGRVWVAEVASADPCLRLPGNLGPVRRLSWSGSGERLAAADDDRKITVWGGGRVGIAHPSARLSLVGHDDSVADLSWAPAGDLLASASIDGQVALWKPGETPDPLQRVDLGEELSCLAWRSDGRGLAVGGAEGTLTLLSLHQRSLTLRPT